jgi:hypothetical protein
VEVLIFNNAPIVQNLKISYIISDSDGNTWAMDVIPATRTVKPSFVGFGTGDPHCKIDMSNNNSSNFTNALF